MNINEEYEKAKNIPITWPRPPFGHDDGRCQTNLALPAITDGEAIAPMRCEKQSVYRVDFSPWPGERSPFPIFFCDECAHREGYDLDEQGNSIRRPLWEWNGVRITEIKTGNVIRDNGYKRQE